MTNDAINQADYYNPNRPGAKERRQAREAAARKKEREKRALFRRRRAAWLKIFEAYDTPEERIEAWMEIQATII